MAYISVSALRPENTIIVNAIRYGPADPNIEPSFA
jgi:hypothetical protein